MSIPGVLTDPDGEAIADSDGTLVGGPYQPLHGYVGIPWPYTDVVDPDDTLVDPYDTVVSELRLSRPNLIAGLLPFFVAEVEVSRPSLDFEPAYGWGGRPWGALSLEAFATEETATLTVSDVGYRTESPVTTYPPRMVGGLSFDARVPLGPAQTGIVYGWGALSIANQDHIYDAYVAAWNAEGRRVSVKYGVKTWDDTTGTFDDPVSGDLITVFDGVAGPWLLSEFALEIPLRDASYLLERPLQASLYEGTGTYEGDAQLEGTALPKTRGVAFNVPLLLIDAANLIYQWNDGPGEVTTLYMGAAEVLTFDADTTDLYTGSTAAGEYRTDNSRGLVQLGLAPDDNTALTADVIGHFPTAGEKLIAADIVRYLLAEDCGVPVDLVDTASFTAAATDYPYEAGWHWPSGSGANAATAVGQCLAAFGAKIVPAISGELSCLVLEPVDPDAVPDADYTTAQIINCEPRALSEEVSPAVSRFRCAYKHNNTIQTSGVLGSADATHRQFVQTADRYAAWVGTTTESSYAAAKDVPAFGGGLTAEADALEVATRYGAIFGTRRWQVDVTLPLVEAIERTFGETIRLTYPMHATINPALGLVVGRSVNVEEATATLTVLI